MIEIDGSLGEGGGQVLRTSLTLSLITGESLRITNIRARRPKPGLRAQHLAAIRAATAVGQARVEGDSIGSTNLIFHSGKIRSGDYSFDIGTAGSTSLLLQTIFLPLSLAGASSEIGLTGGTHVPWSPCFHYLDWHWIKFMQQAGFDAKLSLEKAGYYPGGGGKIRLKIRPICALSSLHLLNRGELKRIQGISAVSNLSPSIAHRQRQHSLARLSGLGLPAEIEIMELPSFGKGTLLLLLAEFEGSQACYFGLGARGKPAEQVADEAVDAVLSFLKTDGVIDEYLADQLLLPLALVTEPSELRTSKVTQHLLTNAQVIQAYQIAKITIEANLGEPGLVCIEPQRWTPDSKI
jgi:RNA 3'-terminal phosphate cyclase (ATP)